MIIFNLKHEIGSIFAEAFMRDSEQFRAYRLKPNNHMQYGNSKVFDSQEYYEAYASHPLHDEFEDNRWK